MAKVVPFQNGKIRLPGPSDRLTLIGKTGSGKSYAALWHLSNQNFHTRPWIVVNPKRSHIYYEIDNMEEFDIGDKIPKHAGLYQVCPFAGEDLDNFFLSIWERENIGLVLDEAALCGFGNGFRTLLIQGREKKIPLIMCTQRPAKICREVFSEAQFFQTFWMNDDRDKKTIREFFPMPDNYRGERLQKFWSWYYDYDNEMTYAMRPVPKLEDSLQRIEDKLDRRAIAYRI